MYDIHPFTGRIIELRRFMNRRPRITEHDPSRERWEMWLAPREGIDRKFVVRSRSMPARVGHAVRLLHVDGAPVGLYNLDTGDRVNFTRADPALLVRDVDGLVWAIGVALAVVSLVVAGAVAVVVAAALVLYFPLVVAARYASRRSLQGQVDGLLDRIQADNVVRPFRRNH